MQDDSRPSPSGDSAVDVLIVGAGISGINAAYRLQERCPDLDYLLVDGRSRLGGTWDLFRYPGIRSDSDFFTLAFPFHPWTGRDAIVDGDEILDYLNEVVRTHEIADHLRMDTMVHAADWSSEDARWTVSCTVGGEPRTISARFVVMCTGYYDYEAPYDPGFAGTDDFAGTLVHPQFWPEDLEVAGRRVAVIGSGATAITLVPALAERGAEVTMVQRTPSYVLSRPRRDVVADAARRLLPAGAAHRFARAKNTTLQWGLFQVSRRFPQAMRGLLRKGAIAGTGSEALVDEHFDPPYDPWDQRLCIAPRGDFFRALRDGGATMVTGHIERFVPEGLRLTDGRVVEADVVVTATGLQIQLLGGIEVSLDGVPVESAETVVYRGAMLGGVPNLAFCVGYINLSWTMRSDMSSRLIARILRRLVDSGARYVVPTPPANLGPTGPLLDMQSGYLARAADLMPRSTDTYPWAMKQNFFADAWSTNRADLDDGLHWEGATASTR